MTQLQGEDRTLRHNLRHQRLLTILMTLALTFSTGISTASAAAEEPNEQKIAALVERLSTLHTNGNTQAADAIFNSLTPEEQDAVVKYTSVANVRSGMTITPVDSGQFSIQSSGGCWTYTFWEIGESNVGVDVFEYELRLNYCSDGTYLTYTGEPTTRGIIHQYPWEYQGTISGPSESYGVGWNTWWVAAQGHFCYSLPGFECLDNQYPYLEPHVYADGTWYNW